MWPLCFIVLAQSAEPVTLARTFAPGEKSAYKVHARVQAEVRVGDMTFFMPFEYELQYGFTLHVSQLKPAGIAQLRYERPSITEIEGETAESPPKTKVEKLGWAMDVHLSPINEILRIVDHTPKKPVTAKWALPTNATPQIVVPGIVGDVRRLALFISGLEGIDFSPKLPLDPVRVGETWHRTVGYSPQALGAGGMAVQRLDYVYTYKGTRTVGGATLHHIVATLQLDTDAAPWLNASLGAGAQKAELKAVRLKLESTIEFDLEPRTLRTRRAAAASTGSIAIEVRSMKDAPIYEEKLRGSTVMTLAH